MTNLFLFDIDYTLFRTDVFKESNLVKYELYEEVPDVLSTLKKSGILGIFSEGKVDFQTKKLEVTGILREFYPEFINIVPDKLAVTKETIDKYTDFRLYVIDDRLRNLGLAKSFNKDAVTVWVKRGIYASEGGFTPDFTMTDLEKLPEVINEE